MSEDYGLLGLTIPVPTDPANVVTAFKNLADDLTTQIAGKATIVTAEESRTNTAYGALTTPDKVEGIVLPAKGLIFVAYEATWKESVAGAARAAIFIGANQLKIPAENGLNDAQAAATNTSTAAVNTPLFSFPGGLGARGAGTGNQAADVTTGQVVGYAGAAGGVGVGMDLGGTVVTIAPPVAVGGPCVIFAAEGTFNVSVQFKASSGSVTAKNRRLYVWTKAFA